MATCSDSIVDISRVTCAHTISQMICSGGISNRNGKITEITRISTNFKWLQVPFSFSKYRSHSAGTVLWLLQVPSLQIRITVLFSADLQTPRSALPMFPVTLPVFQNVSTHFYYPYAHSVIASFTRCRHNRRKMITYRATLPPSWENGTWQVPSQLSHSDIEYIFCFWYATGVFRYLYHTWVWNRGIVRPRSTCWSFKKKKSLMQPDMTLLKCSYLIFINLFLCYFHSYCYKFKICGKKLHLFTIVSTTSHCFN